MLVKRRNIGAHGIASVYEGRTPTTAKKHQQRRKKVTDEFWETVNKPWLDDAIARGDNFRLVSSPNSNAIYVTEANNFVLDLNGNKIKSIFGREVEYIQSKGYTILEDGIAVKY